MQNLTKERKQPPVVITGAQTNGAAKRTGKVYKNKKVIFKNCMPFTNCEIIKTQIDNAEDKDVLIPMYNLIDCSDNYSKT